jgi:carnitine 3-dehydrogenase
VSESVGSPPRSAAVVGCGVIGAAWAARLRLRGVDVSVFDPAPNAEQLLASVMASAVDAWDGLGLPTDRLGSLVMCDSIGAAVDGCEFVQESVPERLDLKHHTLSAIDAATPVSSVVASSTSGFKPSVLAEPLDHPERLVVGHPFNPVYLLPLVEVVGGKRTSDESVDRAMSIYRSLGMHPVHVRVEIDAFVADRLLEAVWREALWLVNDAIATTGEIDDIVRYGFGLRWAQMGMFESYRIAGGDGGMRNFMAQFGPALEWPWTKLVDTPELTDELIDRIADQSDEQAAGRSYADLVAERDRNLVAVLRALESEGSAAGQNLAALRAAST